jgi:predicted TIM-barrel fold metal-dependent hydrolase
METTELFQRIAAEIERIALIDTHEHLVDERTRLKQRIDLFYLFAHYASSDLVSAGMPERTLERLRNPDIPLDERWAEFAPVWHNTRHTGYGRALLLAVRDLFEVDDINDATYQELSERISDSNHSGWYYHVLKERSNIHLAILDPLADLDPTPLEETDRRFFAPVLRVDEFLKLCDRVGLDAMEERTGVALHSLDDLLRAMDVSFERAVAAGVVAVKVAVAYERTLNFDKVTQADAERVFNRLTLYPPISPDFTPQPPVSFAEAKPLQDYLMHQVIGRAIESDLPIQVHTGIQEGNGNFLANAHPLHLVNLLMESREARFDLFHAGYPFTSEMATLGKNFPNAYLDLCWVHVISPWVARQILHEWIETVPSNKIFAFGGDYAFVEGTYAHARMARRNVAEVLVEKVEAGYLTEDEAIALAHNLLHGNAATFFRLPA